MFPFVYPQTLVKEPTEAGVKKHAAGVNKFLEELVKIGKNRNCDGLEGVSC